MVLRCLACSRATGTNLTRLKAIALKEFVTTKQGLPSSLTHHQAASYTDCRLLQSVTPFLNVSKLKPVSWLENPKIRQKTTQHNSTRTWVHARRALKAGSIVVEERLRLRPMRAREKECLICVMEKYYQFTFFPMVLFLFIDSRSVSGSVYKYTGVTGVSENWRGFWKYTFALNECHQVTTPFF